ncbi:MAG: hypothetical protein ACLR23_25625 [Clostridia bacterium]
MSYCALHAEETTCAALYPKDFVGGFWGQIKKPDITRTIALGLTDAMREARIPLCSERPYRPVERFFLRHGGPQIRCLLLGKGLVGARGKDFKHGTGHGVAFLSA